MAGLDQKELLDALRSAAFLVQEFQFVLAIQAPGMVRRSLGATYPAPTDYRDTEHYGRMCSLMASLQGIFERFNAVLPLDEELVDVTPVIFPKTGQASQPIAHTDDVLAQAQVLLVALGLQVCQQPASGGVEGGLLVTGLGSEGLLQQLVKPFHGERQVLHS